MNCIRRKLKSREGMSVLIALVGFMAAAMIAMVVVTAAVTAAERVANDRVTNQDHLTLESAAQIVADEIEGTEYTFSNYDSGKINTRGANCTGAFAQEMKTAVESVDSLDTDYLSKDSDLCAVSLTADTDVSMVEDASVSFVMSAGTEAEYEKYDLIFTLKLTDSQQEVYVKVNGSCTEARQADGKYHITWNVVSINTLTQ